MEFYRALVPNTRPTSHMRLTGTLCVAFCVRLLGTFQQGYNTLDALTAWIKVT